MEGALAALGYNGVSGVRVGKYIELTLETENREEALERVEEMSHRLLANPVIEDYRCSLQEEAS